MTSRWSLVGVLFVSVVINVLQALTIFGLRHRRDSLVTERVLQVGAPAPPLMVVERISGRQVELPVQRNDGKRTVLYVITPECGWCYRNSANVRHLANQQDARFQFAGISLSTRGLVEYLGAQPMPFPFYVPDADLVTSYKLGGGTPQTVVISPEGKVLQNWYGAYNQNLQGAIEDYFSTKLPGLLPDASISSSGQAGPGGGS